MVQVLNFGGGRQTVAMCLLVEQGRLPRPDFIVVADTGREVQSTWDYLDTYMRPRMAAIGLEIHRAGHDLATVDLYDKHGLTLMPVYTQTGKLSTYCSGEWKARVVQRKLRSLGVTGATSWIGFTLDEKRRISGHQQAPWFTSYPLVDLMLTRTDCEQIITDAGLPMPRKSRCWACPHQTDEEWAELAGTDEWDQAVALDEEVRETDERGDVYLHWSRKPLADVVLQPDKASAIGRQCGLGMCFV